MRKLLITLSLTILISLASYSQDTIHNINLYLPKYKYVSRKMFIKPSTPYLYLINKDEYPYKYDPMSFPHNYNPIGSKVIFVGGIRLTIK